jgi:flagellin-like hook-associated protein FlgL
MSLPIPSAVDRKLSLGVNLGTQGQRQPPFDPTARIESGAIGDLKGTGEAARPARVSAPAPREALTLSRAALSARGYDQALRGSGEQVSFLQTAASAVSEAQRLVERMGALAARAVEAPEEGGALQAELKELTRGLSRLAARATFNGERVFSRPVTQVSAEGVDVRLRSLRPETLGRQARALTYGGVVAETSLLGGDEATAGADRLLINGVAIRDSRAEDDPLSTHAPYGSAAAKAAAINAHSAQTGVTALVRPARTDAPTPQHDALLGFPALGSGGPVVAHAMGRGEAIVLNGVRFEGLSFLDSDADGALRAALNARSDATGAYASVGQYGELILEVADGRNLHLSYEGPERGRALEARVGLRDGAGGSVAYAGALTLVSADPIELDLGWEVSEALGGVSGAPGGGLGAVVLGVDRAYALDTATLTDPLGAHAAQSAIWIARGALEAQMRDLESYHARLDDDLSGLATTLSATRAALSQGGEEARSRALTEACRHISARPLDAIFAQANASRRHALALLDAELTGADLEPEGLAPISIF